jgi:hypothetical protein
MLVAMRALIVQHVCIPPIEGGARQFAVMHVMKVVFIEQSLGGDAGI